MKVEEVRVGNIVYRTFEETWEHTFKVEDFDHCARHPENYSGIPLTEKWIKEFGFMNREYSMLLPTWSNGKLELSNNLVVTYNGMQRVFCRWVHQLQNLHFALTGDELLLSRKLNDK